MPKVPSNLKEHSRALLKWAVERGGRFSSTVRVPAEWSGRWDMSVVVGLERRGYLSRGPMGIFLVTPEGNKIAGQYEMPVNERWVAEQKKYVDEVEGE